MLVAVLSGFAAALAAPWIQRGGRGAAGWLMALLPCGLMVYFARCIAPIAAGDVFVTSYAWVPSLGLNLSFRVDGLSLLFALLITGIGALVVIYAGSYLAGHPQLGRFYAYLLVFMASMLGLVLADNVIALYVFWEITSISSYLLIGFNHHREAARAAGLQALLVTGAGGLALLAGLLLLGYSGGSLEISTLLGRGEMVRSDPRYLPILLLILAGACTKSAQVPFHFWLPSAMEAPTPVSAYLHSATMVKAGVYLLARLSPVLSGTEVWYYTVTVVGALTMLLGAILAVLHTDMKRILAYATVSALGTLIVLLGLDTTVSIRAAIVLLFAHALYKGVLFLCAGVVDHVTGSRDVRQLRGLGRSMPTTAAAAGVAALSMIGLPPLFGFISKELLYEAQLQAPRAAPLITAAGVAANILLVAVAGIVGLRPFLGPKTATPTAPHAAPFSLWIGPVLLAALGVVIGLFPETLAGPLVTPAASAVRAAPTESTLALWHGLTPVLALSLLTVACGAGVYSRRGSWRRAAVRFGFVTRWGPQAWYTAALDGLNATARLQTRVLQSGYLRYYLLIISATTLGLAGSALFIGSGSPSLPPNVDVRFYEWVLAVLILLAAVVAVLSRSRLGAVAALGVVGYSVALIFVLFGAPDLAMTQFMVETLTVILFVLVFSHLPRFALFSNRLAVVRDTGVALALGGLITCIVASGASIQLFPKISQYFIDNSVSLAHGRNIVNVILVDFRGFDTLGEITVLAVAGIGVYALLKLRLGKEERQ